MNVQEQPQRSKWYQSRPTWILLGFIAIGGFFLLRQHCVPAGMKGDREEAVIQELIQLYTIAGNQ